MNEPSAKWHFVSRQIFLSPIKRLRNSLILKGDIRFAAFAYNFFIYEVQGSEFCMSMFDHSMQQVVEEVFTKKGPFSWKIAKLGSFVL